MNPTWLYVGVLYALATWRARVPWRVALLFYAMVLIFLFRPMTGDYVDVATDVIKLIPPWSASAPGFTKYDVSNFETQDVPMQLVPWAHQVREAWRHGRLPLWNDLNACGYTLLEIAQSRNLSRTTIRSHLASLFAKTDTRRQSELIALLRSIAVLP